MQVLEVKQVIYNEDNCELALVLPDGRKIEVDLRYETGMASAMVRGQLMQETNIGS